MASKLKGLDFEKTRKTIDKLLLQAKDSVKSLEALQKESVSKARAFLSNDNLVAGLNKVGLATKSQVRDLEKKVDELADELRGQISKIKKTSVKKDSPDSQTSV